MLTTEMVLEKRKSLGSQLGHTGWFHVGCPCIPCRNFYDPTGEEDVKKHNDEIIAYAEECRKAGVPLRSECGALKMDEQTKKFLQDGYETVYTRGFMFSNVTDNHISTKSYSWEMCTFYDNLKYRDEHTEETFKILIQMLRDIQRDGWILFAEKWI